MAMKKIAVLLSGGVNAGSNYSRYLNDLKEMYRALVNNHGYSKSNIYVLYADGSSSDLDGDGNNDIHSGCSLTELNTLFQTTLPSQITSNDFLFIFSTNHGGLTDASTAKAKLWLWGGSIEDSAFASLVNGLNFKYLAVCMEQCYSGGFINDLAGNNRVIVTACQHDEVSWACDSEGNYDEFCYYWTAAVRGEKPGGQAVSADMDGDGFVSLDDAFEYAKANDNRNEHPQYYESPAGLGARLSLSGPKQVAPICQPGTPIPRPRCLPGTPIPRPWCRPGTPIPRPRCLPGTPIPRPRCLPGTPIPRPRCQPGTPIPRPRCRPGTPIPRPRCRPGTPIPRPLCRPGTPIPRPRCQPGTPIPRSLCRPGTPIPRPRCQPGTPIPRPLCRPGTPIPRPRCQPGTPIPRLYCRAGNPISRPIYPCPGGGPRPISTCGTGVRPLIERPIPRIPPIHPLPVEFDYEEYAYPNENEMYSDYGYWNEYDPDPYSAYGYWNEYDPGAYSDYENSAEYAPDADSLYENWEEYDPDAYSDHEDWGEYDPAEYYAYDDWNEEDWDDFDPWYG
ncbi:MAG TPA: hypothetical protein ENI88_01410 [Desulfobulbus sp.]|nr:hypothetical protein [Desulfobulbus sp.]